jgi:tRNA (adenine22-N1)-methyltransferase
MARISARLEGALDLLSGVLTLADVGCDHGFFPIEAIRLKKIQNAIATDNKVLPLATAKENIVKAGMQGQIKTVLSEGLAFLTPEMDGVSIMGMGGTLIQDILDTGDLSHVSQLILGPNNDQSIVREWLQNHGWAITDERFVRDRGHDYQLIRASRGKMVLTDSEKTYGPVILRCKNVLFLQHIKRKIKVLETALLQAKDPQKAAVLSKKIALLQELIV